MNRKSIPSDFHGFALSAGVASAWLLGVAADEPTSQIDRTSAYRASGAETE